MVLTLHELKVKKTKMCQYLCFRHGQVVQQNLVVQPVQVVLNLPCLLWVQVSRPNLPRHDRLSLRGNRLDQQVLEIQVCPAILASPSLPVRHSNQAVLVFQCLGCQIHLFHLEKDITFNCNCIISIDKIRSDDGTFKAR